MKVIIRPNPYSVVYFDGVPLISANAWPEGSTFGGILEPKPLLPDEAAGISIRIKEIDATTGKVLQTAEAQLTDDPSLLSFKFDPPGEDASGILRMCVQPLEEYALLNRFRFAKPLQVNSCVKAFYYHTEQ